MPIILPRDIPHRSILLKWKYEVLNDSLQLFDERLLSIQRKCEEVGDEFTLTTCIIILSKLLKSERNASHPERFVGKKSMSESRYLSSQLSGRDLNRAWVLASDIIVHKKAFSMSRSTAYFTLSLVLDFLKSDYGELIISDVLNILHDSLPNLEVETPALYVPVFTRQQEIFVHVITLFGKKGINGNIPVSAYTIYNVF